MNFTARGFAVLVWPGPASPPGFRTRFSCGSAASATAQSPTSPATPAARAMRSFISTSFGAHCGSHAAPRHTHGHGLDDHRTRTPLRRRRALSRPRTAPCSTPSLPSSPEASAVPTTLGGSGSRCQEASQVLSSRSPTGLTTCRLAGRAALHGSPVTTLRPATPRSPLQGARSGRALS